MSLAPAPTRLALRAELLLGQSGGVGRGGGVGGQRRLARAVQGVHEPTYPSWFAKTQTKVIFGHMTWSWWCVLGASIWDGASPLS